MNVTSILQQIDARIVETLTTLRDGLRREFPQSQGVRLSTKREGRRGNEATGTKALILDVLASGDRLKAKEIAKEIRVSPAATGKHLAALVSSGEVDVRGKSRATVYAISDPRAKGRNQ